MLNIIPVNILSQGASFGTFLRTSKPKMLVENQVQRVQTKPQNSPYKGKLRNVSFNGAIYLERKESV